MEITEISPEDTTDSRHKRRGLVVCRQYRLALLCLGVLCVLQATLNVSLRLLHTSSVKNDSDASGEVERLRYRIANISTEQKHLEIRYEELYKELQQLRTRMRSCQESLQRKRNKPQPDMTCPDGWRNFGSSMYYISTTTNNWPQSRQDCRERGADLVIINNQEEQRFIQGLQMYVWIGLNMTNSEWTWVDGSSLSIRYWGSGEPNSYRSGEECVEIKAHDESLNSWNDEQCTTNRNWVCEREACSKTKHGVDFTPQCEDF